MSVFSATCMDWWTQWCNQSLRSDDLPGEQDFDLLTKSLQADVATAVTNPQDVTSSPCAAHGTDDGEGEDRTVEQPSASAPSSPSLLPSIACEFSLDLSTLDQNEQHMIMFSTPEDQDDAERLIQSLYTGGRFSQPKLLVGQAAARSLIAHGLAKQRFHAQQVDRHGRQTSDKIKPLEQREAEQDWEFHEPTESKDDFARMGVLWRILLSQIQHPKFFSRFITIPLAARNVHELHRLHAKKFLRRCDPPWDEMGWDAKEQFLLAFLIEKFSYDPQGMSMDPPAGAKRKGRNDAGWPGFRLTDTEVIQLASTTMYAYSNAS